MSTELLIALSFTVSLVLSAIGWSVQYVLTRDAQNKLQHQQEVEKKIRALEDALSDAKLSLTKLRDNLHAMELVTLILEIASPRGDDTLLDELTEQVKERIQQMPSAEEFHQRIDELEQVLSKIVIGVDRLSRARVVVPEDSTDTAFGPES